MSSLLSNKILNYGYIGSLTLFYIILVVNIVKGDLSYFSGSIKLSIKNIKLVLLLLVTTTYITLCIPSIRMINQSFLLERTPPRGDRGHRGDRGKSGTPAQCNECGDSLCYKKILFNITKTINFWRQTNKFDILNQNYIIENEYIKDKIKKHCGSKEFKELLTKFGSNNDNTKDEHKCPTDLCPNGDDPCYCGAYDYLFRCWSVWILMILRYKNGMYFLESEGLNENDFHGLIEKEDSFKLGDSAKMKQSYEEPISVQIIDNTEFPFFTLRNINTRKQMPSKVYIKDLESLDEINQTSWDNLFDETNFQSIKHPIYDLKTETYSFKGIKSSELKKIGNVPGGGQLSPFEEIKKYDAWSWGSQRASKPKVNFNIEEVDSMCFSCPSSKLCNPDKSYKGIKIKFSNTYKLMANTQVFENNHSDALGITPFSKLDDTSDNATLFRPLIVTDDNDHPFFREYKPLGDVLLKNTDYTEIENETRLCKPDDADYEGQIITSIKGDKGDTSDNGKPSVPGKIDLYNRPDKQLAITDYKAYDHIYTILVAGDIQPPKDYEFVITINKQNGVNSNESITIWKPIPIDGYVACGYVVDMRPFNGGSDDGGGGGGGSDDGVSYGGSDDDSKAKPSLDLIATIPISAATELGIEQATYTYPIKLKSKPYKTSNFNLFIEEPSITNADMNIPTNLSVTIENDSNICYKSEIPKKESKYAQPSTFKDSKYSINSIYD